MSEIKREQISLDTGGVIDFIPGDIKSEVGALKVAYLRVEDKEENYIGSIDRLPELKRLKKWVDAMIEAKQK